jgi:membrane protease YdiL (CAAX protease family)
MHMQLKLVGTVIGAVALGLVFFGVVMGASMGLVMLNVSQTPQIVWFPLPTTLLLAASMIWAQRRWNIGLTLPAGTPWLRIYVIGIAVTVLGIATALVQGRYTGMVRATELLDADVSPLFTLSYAFYMSVFAAILAEVTFRGVIQVRMQTVLSIWPTVVVIGVVNVLAHRWGPEIMQNWLGLFVTLAGWTWLRWLSKSLWPPLVLHTVANFLVALGLWYQGPLVHADLSDTAVIGIAMTGLVGLALAASLSRSIKTG